MLLLPIDFEVAGKTMKWYRGDSEKRYQQNLADGNEPSYGPNDILYQFNSLGYRAPEIKPKNPRSQFPRICFYGCSLMEGYGLPEDQAIPAKFADAYGQVYGSSEFYNFGKASASNDDIANIIVDSEPIVQPDLVVVYWTYFSRRALYTEDGKILKWNKHWDNMSVPISEKYHPLCEAQRVLINNNSNVNNFIKNFRLVKYYLRNKGISMLWGLANSKWMVQIGQYLEHDDLKTYADLSLDSNLVDYSRDMMHPGPESVDQMVTKLMMSYASIHR
jgi:hypothetical protein